LTFAYFIGAQAPLTLPGAPFLLAAALLLLALAIAVRTLGGRTEHSSHSGMSG
jgi:DHA1 family tetracycline resistance protein-like MFS transporter